MYFTGYYLSSSTKCLDTDWLKNMKVFQIDLINLEYKIIKLIWKKTTWNYKFNVLFWSSLFNFSCCKVICLLLAPSAGEPILYMTYMPLKTSKMEPLWKGWNEGD